MTIEINQEEDRIAEADEIDNEEEGGEWVTEENIHKHLSHGLLLPVEPVEVEEGEVVVAEAPALEAVQEEEAKEEENQEFPAFDEA